MLTVFRRHLFTGPFDQDDFPTQKVPVWHSFVMYFDLMHIKFWRYHWPVMYAGLPAPLREKSLCRRQLKGVWNKWAYSWKSLRWLGNLVMFFPWSVWVEQCFSLLNWTSHSGEKCKRHHVLRETVTCHIVLACCNRIQVRQNHLPESFFFFSDFDHFVSKF